MAAGAHSAFACFDFAGRDSCSYGTALLKKWRVTSGENTDNEETSAADRPKLFQEADAAEARSFLAERFSAVFSIDLDYRTNAFEGFTSLQQGAAF
jgi:hypothetical protein